MVKCRFVWVEAESALAIQSKIVPQSHGQPQPIGSAHGVASAHQRGWHDVQLECPIRSCALDDALLDCARTLPLHPCLLVDANVVHGASQISPPMLGMLLSRLVEHVSEHVVPTMDGDDATVRLPSNKVYDARMKFFYVSAHIFQNSPNRVKKGIALIMLLRIIYLRYSH